MIRQFIQKFKRLFGSDAVIGRAELAEDVLYGKMSTADLDAVKAVAQLTSSLCNNKVNAAFDAGVFVFFKIRNEEGEYQIFHKRLNVRERTILNERPTLLKQPHLLLDHLEGAIGLDHKRAAELRLLSPPEDI